VRTWIYRVAHAFPNRAGGSPTADRSLNLDRLSALIQRLKLLDRQVIVSYLESTDAASIGEITGLSPANVAMRIHRIKNLLAKRFHEGGRQGGNDAG
jgi:DNA-directed RNA polymerase specialized sigma24 family protein